MRQVKRKNCANRQWKPRDKCGGLTRRQRRSNFRQRLETKRKNSLTKKRRKWGRSDYEAILQICSPVVRTTMYLLIYGGYIGVVVIQMCVRKVGLRSESCDGIARSSAEGKRQCQKQDNDIGRNDHQSGQRSRRLFPSSSGASCCFIHRSGTCNV